MFFYIFSMTKFRLIVKQWDDFLVLYLLYDFLVPVIKFRYFQVCALKGPRPRYPRVWKSRTRIGTISKSAKLVDCVMLLSILHLFFWSAVGSVFHTLFLYKLLRNPIHLKVTLYIHSRNFLWIYQLAELGYLLEFFRWFFFRLFGM